MDNSTASKDAWAIPQTPLFFTSFLLLGFPDGMLGVLWPSIGGSFGQAIGNLGIVLAVITAGASGSSFLVGRALRFWRIGVHLAVSIAIMTAAVSGFAYATNWAEFLLAAFAYGIGAGGVDSGINAYTSAHRGTRYLNQLHALYGLGVTLGPLVATLAIEHGVWRDSYLILLPALAVLAIASSLIRSKPKRGEDNTMSEIQMPDAGTGQEIHREVRIATILVLFFLYTGLEFTTGQWAFTFLTRARGLAIVIGGVGVATFGGSLTLGRFIAGVLGNRMSHRGILLLSSALALAGESILAWSTVPAAAFWGLPVAGLGLGPFFPTLISAVPSWTGKARSNSVVGWGVSSAGIGIGVASVSTAIAVNVAGLNVLSFLLFGLGLILLIAVLAGVFRSQP